ncbi:hypothetical protein GCM10022276_04580 [Sphingomonas limnosediminicola]|jgi:hypothetical protein|uniref:BLUF domain-containing protein n=1 Tax=Sphingomonas limnosediminicola TaxID=940133 RepID=A0ABP7KVT0_9SPHN
MDLTSLTYTSLARAGLKRSDIEAIHRSARELNALDGLTGLLIFNGTHFLQIVEGTRSAIDALMVRLRQDPRHTGLEIRDERRIAERCFPGWAMELAHVEGGFFKAREAIAERLPDTVPEEIQLRLFRMTELISTLQFDD